MAKFIPSPLPSERHWSEDRDDSFKKLVAEKLSGMVEAKTPGQQRYLDAINDHVVTLCSGPAGTGKTFMAIGVAVRHLKQGKVDRIVLTRPLQECGERLGTLPGDVREKTDDIMQPMLDALHDFLDAAEVERLRREEVIQVIPLAKMRGRSLRKSFILMDEAQNCTGMQLRMFLTRFEGKDAKVVVVGDETQSDLPYQGKNSLSHAVACFSPQCHEDVAVVRLGREDIVRHPLIQWIDERLLDGPPEPGVGVALTPCPECDRPFGHTHNMREKLVTCPHCRVTVELLDEKGRLDPIAIDAKSECVGLLTS